jgi:thiopeptide-type bacteriocin biosynthesis protein
MNKNLTHHLVKIEADSYVDAVIGRAAEGASIQNLAEALALEVDAALPLAEIEEYILTLVENQVLVPGLFPLVTGEGALEDLMQQLEHISAAHDILDKLKQSKAKLVSIDDKGLGADTQHYSEITALLTSLPTAFTVEKLFQTDMLKPADEATLSQSVVKELINAVHVLSRFNTKEEAGELKLFTEAFTERYGTSRVPLLEALDSEAGIGFGEVAADDSSLLPGFRLQRNENADSENLHPVHAFLLKKLSKCLQEGSSCLELTDDLPPRRLAQQLPDSLCINAEIVAASTDSIRRGEFNILVNHTVGPDGARALARFCHLDSGLAQLVRQHLREEESHNLDCVYAEIVHLPEWRIGNVISRPVLRDYEIAYLGRSGAPKDQQISASDLWVTVENGDIRLYSSKLGRRVIPRLTTAHGFHLPYFNPLYRFLCFLQIQHGISGPLFSWGPLESLEYLPRVCVGRVVTALARWRIAKHEMDQLENYDGFGLFVQIQELCERHRLPRFAGLIDSDNVLFVDFHNPLSVEACFQVMKRLPAIMFQEVYPTPEMLCVTSTEGSFWHELLVPLVHAPTVQTNSTARPKQETKEKATIRPYQSKFFPGDNWLYLKAYGGLNALDEILRQHIPPVLNAGKAAACFSHWFFIRYADPREHLRIRFHGNADRLLGELLPILINELQPLTESGKLWKIQLDTYQRETERYGGEEGVIEAEHIFSADSEAVLEILTKLPVADDAVLRWRITLLSIDSLLNDFGLGRSEKLAAMEKMCFWIQSQYRFQTRDRIALAELFRREKRTLEPMLWDHSERDPVISLAREVFLKRSRTITKNIEKVKILARDGALSVNVTELIGSYLHMHVNRLLRSGASEHEAVLYEFLLRLYESELARSRLTHL